MVKPAGQGVDNTHRRTWDKEEYAERARIREEEELEAEERRNKPSRGLGVQRAPLKKREFEVDLASRLGKTQIVTHVTPLNQQAGFYCNVCECVVKDSANYLDHINGKKHQRALGMSMRVERSSLSQVQERFEKLKQNSEKQSFSEEEFDNRIRMQKEEEEKRKLRKKEKKKEKKEFQLNGNEEFEDPEMASLMGFVGFGSRKP